MFKCGIFFALLLLHCSRGDIELHKNCTKGWIELVGDGNCDSILNNEGCLYDGGDCCECTCDDGDDFSCGYSGFNCLNENATACLGELVGKYPDCEGDLAFLGDGSCDYENNNENCGYDEGDCCECNCSDGLYYSCDENNRFNCMDPDSQCFNASAVSVYPNCINGSIATIGDSICDDDNNNEACGYDEGDCCECTCTDGLYPSCGLYDFNCLDPDSPNGIYNCEETPSTVPPCPDGGQRDWVVENTSQAQLLSEAVYCSGGMFSVTWKGNITINTTILVLNGTVLSVTGHSTNASIDGGSISRMFTVVNASLHVTDVVLSNGRASSGGAVAASGSYLTFNHTAFVNNTTPNSGAALYVSGGSTIAFHEDTLFSNNSADGRGGGIYVTEDSRISFFGDAVFMYNYGSRGGGLYSTGMSTILWAGTANFTDNMASMRGGAVCLDGNSVATWLRETDFSGNAAGSSAVFLNEGSSASWEGPTGFSGNRAFFTAGGAARVTDGSKVTWTANLTFSENTAVEDGGALAVTTSSCALWSGETLFLNNNASGNGGALTLADSSIVEWNSSTRFVGNYGEESGGAIFAMVNSSVTWSGDTIFLNNTAHTESGGAILITKESVIEWVGQTNFLSNTAGSNGGAVASYPYDPNSYSSVSEAESTLEVNGPTTFINNSCDGNGGGLALLGTLDVSFGTSDVSFLSNTAEVSGGAVFISSTATGPVFTDLKFDSNYAQMGGAVYATGSGTAVSQDVSYPTKFVGCTFTGNTALATGGAIESAAGVDVLRDSYFYRNEAEVGGALRLAGTATLDNCSFIENISGEDRGPAVSNIGYMSEIDECYFRGNMYHCDSEEYLEFDDDDDDGGIYDTICVGCSVCNTCIFYDSISVPRCASTMENTKSDGGTDTIEDIVVNAGFWRATNESNKVLPCYNPDACPEGVTSGICNPGYQGPYCSICSKNYTNSIQYTCTECYDRSSGIAMITVLMAFGTSIAISVFFHLVSGGKEGTGPGIVNRLKRNIPLQSFKIIIVAWQILTQFASVADVTYPDIYRHLLNALDVLNFDISWAFTLGCFVDVDFHDRMLIMTIGPIVVICLLGITYFIGIRRNRQSDDALRNIRHKHVSMVLLVTFLVYSSVSSVLFQMFHCEHLDDGKYYLQADYRIECDTSKHQILEVYAAVMIVLFPIGIPVFYAYLLFRSHTILINGNRRENDVSVEPISDLWNPYKPSRFYYEVIECIRRILLTSVVFLVDDDTAAQIAGVLMIAFIFGVLFEVLAPYETQLDTWVSRTGHAVVFSSMYFALLLKVEVSSESSTSQQVFEVILVVSHACMVLAVVFEAVIVTCSLRPTTQQEPRRGSFARYYHWKRTSFPFNRGVPPVETFDLELTVRPSRSARFQ